jgi:hypothetical protein
MSEMVRWILSPAVVRHFSSKSAFPFVALAAAASRALRSSCVVMLWQLPVRGSTSSVLTKKTKDRLLMVISALFSVRSCEIYALSYSGIST